MTKYNATRWVVLLSGIAFCFIFFTAGAMITHPEWTETKRTTRKLTAQEAADMVPKSKLTYSKDETYGLETTTRITHHRGLFGYSSTVEPAENGDQVLFMEYPKR